MVIGSLRFILALLVMVQPPMVLAEFDHQPWDRLLKQNLAVLEQGKVTQVNYAAMMSDREQLRGYLDTLAAVPRAEFNSWDLDEQLAFLINAYNAWTVELILSEYPDIDSIRDIGFLPGAAWRRDLVSLFGEQVSLDDVEHGMIRGWGIYNEPRIHFAVNCAAVGCPALRPEAFSGTRLEQQLEESTRFFLSDSNRNYVEDNEAHVSRIFDWYEEDFESGWLGVNSVGEFLARYQEALALTEAEIAALRNDSMRIRYLRYDWSLNDIGS